MSFRDGEEQLLKYLKQIPQERPWGSSLLIFNWSWAATEKTTVYRRYEHPLFAENHGETVALEQPMVFLNPSSSSGGPHHHHEPTGVGRPQLSPEPCENCKHTGRGQLSCSRPTVFRKPSPAAGPGRWLLARSSALSPADPGQAILAS